MLIKATQTRSFSFFFRACVSEVSGDCNLRRVLDDEFLQFLNVGAAEAVDLLSLLNEHKGGHRGDVVLHGKFFALIDIDLK